MLRYYINKYDYMYIKKSLIIIFVCFYSMISFANDSLSLVNKVILCIEVDSDHIVMTGFKFINENQVKYLHKNTHTEKDSLTQDILDFKSSLNQIRINGGIHHYNHLIYRDTLDIFIGVYEPDTLAWKGERCEVKNPRSDDFVLYFNTIFAQTLLKAKMDKKI